MKNRRRKINQLWKRKWIVILVVALLLVIFGRVVDNKSLSQSGIVIGMAIDIIDDDYVVSAQAITISGGAANGKSSDNYITYSASGKSLTKAIDGVSKKLGLLVSLSHCNLIVMSKSALLENCLESFSTLIGPYALPHQAVIVATEEDTTTVLSKKVPSTQTLPFFAQSVILQSLGTGGYTKVTVKDFLAGILSKSQTVCLPLLRFVKLDGKPISSSQTSGIAFSTANDEEELFVVNLENGYAITKSQAFVLNAKTAKTVNFVLSKDLKDTLCVTLDDGGSVDFRIIRKNVRSKANGTNINTEIELVLSFLEAHNLKIDGTANCNTPEVKRAAQILAENIVQDIKDCFALSQEYDADLLQLVNVAYRNLGAKLPPNALSLLTLSTTCTTSLKENS